MNLGSRILYTSTSSIIRSKRLENGLSSTIPAMDGSWAPYMRLPNIHNCREFRHRRPLSQPGKGYTWMISIRHSNENSIYRRGFHSPQTQHAGCPRPVRKICTGEKCIEVDEHRERTPWEWRRTILYWNSQSKNSPEFQPSTPTNLTTRQLRTW